MGIPRKKPPHPLVQGVKAFGKGLLSIPLALKEIPNLPKRKLLKLTGFFFMGSLAVYYITGPYQKTIYMRHYKYGEELEKVQAVSSRLKTENLELCQDARAAKTYRDELDVLRERAEKVDKLEAELLRYKDKMNDIEFFKSRVEELREDNRILVETKEMLEEQLAGSRKRCEAVLGLENDLIRVQGDLERLQHEREASSSLS